MGDLVVVTRWPSCGCCLGNVGTVIGFKTTDDGFCNNCNTGASLDHGGNCARVKDSKGVAVVPLEWLKRIPPLDEPAETYTTEKDKEPA